MLKSSHLLRLATAALLAWGAVTASASARDPMAEAFQSPPDDARPWVYWYFMDGNLTREGMTADLEAMKRAGIGGALFLEVNVGVPRGPVTFMSAPWQNLFAHAVSEADRLGLEMALGSGPGWCGSGGPWVKPEQSMQHLVGAETRVTGPARFDGVLPRPRPRAPYFGEGTLTPELRRAWETFYADVAVLAFPTPAEGARLADLDEKALYFREPYSSKPGVKPFLPAPADHPSAPAAQCIPPGAVVELTDRLGPDGRLAWDVPAGAWTILRLGRTTTGQTTRPAPEPGLGFESDKFDRAALDAHFDAFAGKLAARCGKPSRPGRGLTTLHFDSWEMSSQNWSPAFRTEFRKRRGYDPLPYLPAMTGLVVGSPEISERFLWDLRQTAQELVLQNHAQRLKELGRRHGMVFSLEPYDLNPCSDLELGGVADVPMCEFWSKGYGFNTEFSCVEAVSVAHTMGRTIVGAEAFTAGGGEKWRQHPASMKAQTDWAMAIGINRLVFHTFQHQPWLDRWPGMTMGPYGVHWQRTQTWWDMASGYHAYLTRCQAMLRRGLPVADILYLAPEGAPMVFRPPASATTGDPPDRRGHAFDGCAPGALLERATVRNGAIAFPDGMSYRVLVLPRFETMTPALLRKVGELVAKGATVIGAPPRKSPGLSGYPTCDEEVRELAAQIWDPARPRRALTDEGTAASAGREPEPLRDAQWIWRAEGSPAAAAPVGTRRFRRIFDVTGTVESATLVMTADNSFEASINGRPAGEGDNFHQQYVTDATALLRPGSNELAVTADNGGDAPNPAGLIGALTIRYRGGARQVVATDRRWRTARPPGVEGEDAAELGPWTMAPWRLSGGPTVVAEIYPAYDATARMLERMGVPPDFEAEGGVRYIHRREGDTDLYFVAHRETEARTVACRFRVAGRQPEWWDPLTGARRILPEFTQRDGITTVPIAFDALGSGFVVFRDPAPSAATTGRNFPNRRAVATLEGPWDVSFDPAWGGPARATFATLEDWSTHAEPSIRHFSGTAVYRKTFDGPALSSRSGRLFLDLGAVQVMARVSLNGRDLGVAWCVPWQVEIPPGLLRAQGNQLEVAVANLWVNRLIGDSGLPAEQRKTWTTYNPYKPDSPLLPSGLLGPVRVLVE